MDGTVARGDGADAGGQEVEGAQEEGVGGVAGGYPLTSRPPWGCCQEVGAFNQPYATQKVGHF